MQDCRGHQTLKGGGVKKGFCASVLACVSVTLFSNMFYKANGSQGMLRRLSGVSWGQFRLRSQVGNMVRGLVFGWVGERGLVRD